MVHRAGDRLPASDAVADAIDARCEIGPYDALPLLIDRQLRTDPGGVAAHHVVLTRIHSGDDRVIPVGELGGAASIGDVPRTPGVHDALSACFAESTSLSVCAEIDPMGRASRIEMTRPAALTRVLSSPREFSPAEEAVARCIRRALARDDVRFPCSADGGAFVLQSR